MLTSWCAAVTKYFETKPKKNESRYKRNFVVLLNMVQLFSIDAFCYEYDIEEKINQTN